MASVSLRQLRKCYDNGHVAVEGASFDVADGELLVLVGPSGCGKSTLLRMIAGLESISSGELCIDGARVNDLPPKQRDIAMVFQNYALYPHMTVAENLAFGLKLRGLAKADWQARIAEAADMLELTELLQRLPKQLSGGQRQRVALGRALVRHPKVFLLDEPLSNLDARLRGSMRAEISRLHRRLGATMIYVTHDQIEAMTLGQRIVVLRDGVIQQIDTPMALYQRPANTFVAGFLGSPGMNLWQMRRDGAEWMLTAAMGNAEHGLRIADARVPAEGESVVMGVRPEHLRPATAMDSYRLQAVLETIEPVGNEVFLHFNCAGQSGVARVSPEQFDAMSATVDDVIELGLNPSNWHWFDPQMGRRLD
ncbi:MAG: sn-glycerol-3-phosphate ABC transporter ATP-binding protein UgpC [Xanthomonadales bacterium]|nr:sn-glycerol-3-phosphate ABC transporter ATP-binding protein UgpC [Xanthomonadales bacterium]